jgi:hypothetical protein
MFPGDNVLVVDPASTRSNWRFSTAVSVVDVNVITVDGLGVVLEAVRVTAAGMFTPGLDPEDDLVVMVIEKPLGRPLKVNRMFVPFGRGVVLVDDCVAVRQADAKPSAMVIVARLSAKFPEAWFENTRNAPLFVPVTALWVMLAMPGPKELTIERLLDPGAM